MTNIKTNTAGFAIGFLSMFAVSADDTDIFLGTGSGSADDGEGSTIFFMLDNSGSMNGKSSNGGNQKKLDMVKEAMRDFVTARNNDADAENLRIGFGSFYQSGGLINYPALTVQGEGVYGDQASDEIVAAVDELKGTGATSLVGAYYEAMAYMMAKPVLYGLPPKKGKGWEKGWVQGRGWLAGSLPASMEGEPPYYNFNGLTNNSCGANNIVLLTDGKTSKNAYRDLQRADPDALATMVTDPDDGGPCIDYGFNQERCGVELADYALNRRDVDDPDAPPILTHTIGIDLQPGSNAEQYLQRVANAGSGQYLTPTTKDDLVRSFEAVTQNHSRSVSSFSPPTVPIETGSQLYSSSEIFISLFETDRKSIWNGNVKKFHLCEPDSSGCETGEYLGSDNQVATDSDGNLLDFVGDVWDVDSTPSASNVLSGGLASKVENWQSRNIFTWTASTYPEDVDTSESTNYRGWNLYRIDSDREILADSDLEPDYTDDSDVPGDTGRLRKRLVQAHNLCAKGSTADTECLNTLVKFLLGAKTRSQQTDGPVTDNRWPIADLMHGEILSIPFGKTASGESIYKLAFGTNDGGFHVHDARTGEEHFVIYPQEVLDQLANLESANSSTKHIYGLDGGASFRIRDVDGDMVIEPEDGDFVHVYIGMRRGGYLYYAFNLTPDSTINSHGDAIGDPELLWTLQGTMDDDDPLSRLGQTWSRPQYTRILVEENGTVRSKSVLIFGGGYDADVEDGSGNFGVASESESNLGNAIYIVDADSGEVLWWASSDFKNSAGSDGLEVQDMNVSIAADINLVDSNNDHRTDRLYAVDLTGQVWRVDLNPVLSDSSVGLLANLSESGDPEDSQDNEHERKFFYEPDFARIKDTTATGTGENTYDAIALVSGNRADPTNHTVRDRSYVIRDYLNDETIQPLGSASPTNFPACNPSVASCTAPNPIDDNSLLDVTNEVIVQDESIEVDPVATEALTNSSGFYFDLLTNEEIGFSKTQILAGKLYFTTFSNVGNNDSSSIDLDDPAECGKFEGSSSLYIVDVISGAPITTNVSGQTSVENRAYAVGEQPISKLVPVVTRTDSGGAVIQGRFQSGIKLPPDPLPTELQFYPTFWYQK